MRSQSSLSSIASSLMVITMTFSNLRISHVEVGSRFSKATNSTSSESPCLSLNVSSRFTWLLMLTYVNSLRYLGPRRVSSRSLTWWSTSTDISVCSRTKSEFAGGFSAPTAADGEPRQLPLDWAQRFAIREQGPEESFQASRRYSCTRDL